MYKNAMELSESGLCKSYLSYKYVTRGTASLPCLYFIQWANYACLYVYLLGLNSFKKEPPFDGGLFKDHGSAMDTCLYNMEKLWDLFIQNFNITSEQRIVLFNLCIGKLMEVSIVVKQ